MWFLKTKRPKVEICRLRGLVVKLSDEIAMQAVMINEIASRIEILERREYAHFGMMHQISDWIAIHYGLKPSRESDN